MGIETELVVKKYSMYRYCMYKIRVCFKMGSDTNTRRLSRTGDSVTRKVCEFKTSALERCLILSDSEQMQIAQAHCFRFYNVRSMKS